MVALATIWFATSRAGAGGTRDTGSRSRVAAVVCIGLIVPFFLPYMQHAGIDGIPAHARAGSIPRTSARGWLRRRGRIAGGCRASSSFSEVLFPGILAIVAGRGWRRGVSRWRDAQTGPERDDGAGSTSAWRVFTFWLTFGPDAGLYTVLYLHRSGVLVPARAVAHRASSSRCAWSCSPRRR